MDDTTLTIGQLAGQAGLRTSGVLPGPAREGGRRRYRGAAARRPEDVDALIERTLAMRTWLVAATDCSCTTLDACGLFAPAGGPAAPLGAVAGAG